MALTDRIRLIKEIQTLRGSKVIAYITSDRLPPFQAQMAMDAVRLFYDHLSQLQKGKKIDVFLFSVGGDTMVPWRLTNLIREYCQHFSVIVHYKAHSAATMLALGADEVVMGPLGELSPIDSSVQTPYNPPHADQPNEPKTPISVEDVMGFFNLARDRIGITNQNNLIKAFSELSERVHPLAIGAIYRSHALTRLLATKLLESHRANGLSKRAATRIVDELAEKLYYHNYTMSRVEAKKLGMPVKFASPEVEHLMAQLYSHYEMEMQLSQSFNPNVLTPDRSEITLPVAMIESQMLSNRVNTTVRIQQSALPNQPSLLQVESGQWIAETIPQEA